MIYLVLDNSTSLLDNRTLYLEDIVGGLEVLHQPLDNKVVTISRA
jgi:hypothetical protein